jgi:hypothetical protein
MRSKGEKRQEKNRVSELQDGRVDAVEKSLSAQSWRK